MSSSASAVLAVRVPQEVADAFVAASELHHRTLADELRAAIEAWTLATADALSDGARDGGPGASSRLVGEAERGPA